MDCLLDHPVISERYFFPRPDQPPATRDFWAADGVRLRCFEHSPHPGAKTLVHYHGNGETVADYLHDFVDAVAALGANLLLVEYRGYGGSGGIPQLGKMLDDVAAVRQAYGLEPGKTVLYGRSVGAIFALEWAFQEPGVSALVLESGVADPLQRLTLRLDPEELGVTAAELAQICDQRLNHRTKLANFTGTLLVLHAAGDSLVTADHAHLHMQWAERADKRLVLFPRGDHNTIFTYNGEEILRHLQPLLE